MKLVKENDVICLGTLQKLSHSGILKIYGMFTKNEENVLGNI